MLAGQAFGGAARSAVSMAAETQAPVALMRVLEGALLTLELRLHLQTESLSPAVAVAKLV
jgi:hypothetical protein